MSVKNYILPRRNPDQSNAYEKHLPGSNYIGPETDIVRRLNEKIIPTTQCDKAAMRHDIDYFNIRSKLRDAQIIPSMAKKAVRASDNLLIQAATKAANDKTNLLNRTHGKLTAPAIKSKKIAENIGVLDPLKFVGKGKDPLKKMRKALIGKTKKQKTKRVRCLSTGTGIQVL